MSHCPRTEAIPDCRLGVVVEVSLEPKSCRQRVLERLDRVRRDSRKSAKVTTAHGTLRLFCLPITPSSSARTGCTSSDNERPRRS
jgi:hypothetical protein